MTTIISCRSYDPPGLWCAPCRAGRTDLCEDPCIRRTPEQKDLYRRSIDLENKAHEELRKRRRANRWWRRAFRAVFG